VKDPSVHHRGNGLPRSLSERLPQVGGLGVAELVPLQVEANAVAEHLGADVLLEHPQDGGALLVGEEVEHRLAVLRRLDLELDGPCIDEAVHTHRRRPRDAERHPALPLGLPRIDGEQLHERGERFVEPDAVPPEHGDEVAEPHVGHLVGDDVGHALDLGVRGRPLVHQERRLAKGNGAHVLHGPRREVGNGEEVELVAGIRQAVVLLEELE
jgi:hypothetical protein